MPYFGDFSSYNILVFDFQSSPYYVSDCVDYCDNCYGSFITDVIVDFKGEVVNVDQREVPDVKLLMWMGCSISGHCDKQ